jgi:hypothetical protein
MRSGDLRRRPAADARSAQLGRDDRRLVRPELRPRQPRARDAAHRRLGRASQASIRELQLANEYQYECSATRRSTAWPASLQRKGRTSWPHDSSLPPRRAVPSGIPQRSTASSRSATSVRRAPALRGGPGGRARRRAWVDAPAGRGPRAARSLGRIVGQRVAKRQLPHDRQPERVPCERVGTSAHARADKYRRAPSHGGPTSALP